MTTKKPVILWVASAPDQALILKIMKRAKKMKLPPAVEDPLGLQMDVTACHLNGTPLNLQKLLEVEDFTFAHDVVGINRNINRSTAKIDDCFLPRCHS